MRKIKSILIFLTVLIFFLGLAVFSYPYVNGLLVNMKKNECRSISKLGRNGSVYPRPI